MRTFRIFAAVVVAAGGLTLGSSAAGAEPPGTTDVSVAVPMTCTGATPATTINVSATLPNRVRAGRAYTITNLTTDVPNDGAVTLSTSGGHPATISAGSGGSSTLQLAAPAQPGGTVTLQVTRADYLLPGSIEGPRPILIPGSPVGCAPAAPVTLGAIKVLGPASRPDTATTAIDATLGMRANILDLPFASHAAHVTVTVPTQLHPGDTLNLTDLQVTVQVPFTPQPFVAADGTDGAGVVTAQPGETVELRLVVVNYDIGVVVSFPLGSGHLASIPVVAR